MHVDFAVSTFVTNADRTQTALIFHHKYNIRMQPGGHVEPGELPHEAALRETKEELGLDARMDPEVHTRDTDTSTQSYLVPNPIATYRSRVPVYKNVPAHIHCDFWYILIADEMQPFGGEANQSKRYTKEEVLAIPDDEILSGARIMAKKWLV